MRKPLILFLSSIFLTTVVACNLPLSFIQDPIGGDSEEQVMMNEPAVIEPSVPIVVEENPQEPSTDISTVDLPIEAPVDDNFVCSPGTIAAKVFSVEFCFPLQYSDGITAVRVPENPPTEDYIYWVFNPNFLRFTLAEYPILNKYHTPIIEIYPKAKLAEMDEHTQLWVDDLLSLLASMDPYPSRVPFLPIFNAVQQFIAQVNYLNFRNGRGVRFITQYGQDISPITDDRAIYSFVGLTNDDNYIVIATIPITHPLFSPSDQTEPPEGWDVFYENFTDYKTAIEADLAVQTPESFYPNLAALDEMISSLLVPPEAIP